MATTQNYFPRKSESAPMIYAYEDKYVLSRVCKNITHKYMNGINCIYLNYRRYGNGDVSERPLGS